MTEDKIVITMFGCELGGGDPGCMFGYYTGAGDKFDDICDAIL